jgi:two-component system cell cycle sensor histidine kinase/response regulator CckA
MVMPAMGGREVAARLAQANPGLRVIYMSGHVEQDVIDEGLREPRSRYLAKPFTPEELLGLVEEVLSLDQTG